MEDIRYFERKIEEINNKMIVLDKKSGETTNLCLYCNKVMSNKSNLTKHIGNTCKTKKVLLDKKDEYFNELCRLRQLEF